MAILMILSMIIMQFFNSASKVWSNTEKRNQVYSDARIVMNLISNDLQAMMYNNQNSTEGVFPLWYEAKKISDFEESSGDYNGSDDRQKCISGREPSDSPLLKVQQLSFIAKTDVRNTPDSLDVCEVKYTFLPVNFRNKKRWCLGKKYDSGTDYVYTVDDINDPKDWERNDTGILLRSCASNKIKNSSDNFVPSGRENFQNFPFLGNFPNRVINIFNDIDGDETKINKDCNPSCFAKWRDRPN
ncbi:MAG: hypothetical protein GY718_16570 [Lentisphaerae bacterium]|nr:hypothetical protein [Lentisphaerota bacterium]